jgi:hypothetical protein
MRGASKELLGEAYTTLHATPCLLGIASSAEAVSLGANTIKLNTLPFLEQVYGFAFKALLRYAFRA